MSIILMILLLGFLILIHELGHFMAARALGIKVSKFAIGFPIGPTLWSKKIGDVEYLIHACLLGGYLSFPDDDKDSDLPEDSMDRFSNRPVWQRMIVISAGVFMNLVVAFLLVFLVAGVWGKLPTGEANVYVGKIVAEKGASVLQSGMQNGDKFITINGKDIKSHYALHIFTSNSAQYDGKVAEDLYNKNLQALEKLNSKLVLDEPIKEGTVVKLPARSEEKALELDDDVLKGLAFYKDTETKLSKEQIALRDSLINKNTYVADGVATLSDVAYAISDNVKPLNIVVLRNGKEVKLKTIYPDKNGKIGFMPDIEPINIETKTPMQVIKNGSKYLYDQTAMQIYALGQLCSGKIPAKEMHGIVAVAKIGGDVIEKGGLSSGLLLTAIISAWLAILNFLPIPVLDGGHFMFMLIEILRGKPVSQKFIDDVGTVFFVILLIVAFLLIFNDIYALITHKF